MSDKDTPRTDELDQHLYNISADQNDYRAMAALARELERELSLRAPASGDAPCGCEFSDAGELEQMCMAHWRYAFVTINAGKHPPYIPGLPPVTLNAALAASRGD
jgi:hypothetical protein